MELNEKPLLKWVGGKTQILHDVLALFPKEIKTYYEPFIGGGSVLIGLLELSKQNISVKKVIASDLNKYLINFYKSVQKHPNDLIKQLKIYVDEFKLIKQFNKDDDVSTNITTIDEAKKSKESYYYYMRYLFNQHNNISENQIDIKNAAIFLFLNKTGFRGIYREGPNGFNVPFGNYKNPTILDQQHILRISELTKDVEFKHQSFDEIQKNISKINKKDFIYFDPPYAPENSKSFVKYTSDGFSLETHKSFFELCNNLNDKKIKWLVSNSNVDLVNESLKNYNVQIIECKRSINSKKPNSKTEEVLISNYNLILHFNIKK